jgi:hypothetical protein
MKETSVKKWIARFLNNEFESNNVKTQIDAGWYDWFCKDESLRNKTYRMGRIVKQVKDGGKVDLNNWYVWFKNNWPMSGKLYDDFRFALLKTGDVMFTIQMDCPYQKHKYSVYGRKPTENGYTTFFEEPLFECDNSRDLVKWLNTPWEK